MRRTRPTAIAHHPPHGAGPDRALSAPIVVTSHPRQEEFKVEVSSVESSVTRREKLRKLKPEIAAQLAVRRREAQLRTLYERPVEELSPEEIARMKAAFFRS